MEVRSWNARWLLAGLWVASAVAAFLIGRHEAAPAASARDTVSVGRAAEAVPPKTRASAEAEPTTVVDPHPHRTAATYGYRNLVFTPELGEELIRLTELGEEDYIRSYVGLDELAASMSPEALKAALVFLKERGLFEDQKLGAPGHLSFQLGKFLGEEGVEFARSLGADVDNTLLGWCQADPAGGLTWLDEFLGTAGGDELGLRREQFWRWAIESHPEVCLDLYIKQLEAGMADRASAVAFEIAAIGTRFGRWDLLEAHADELVGTENNFRWRLARAMADQRAASDPWGTLESITDDLPAQWKSTLEQSALAVLAQREPLALWDYLRARDSEDASESAVATGALIELGGTLPDETLRQALADGSLPPATRGALTMGFLRTIDQQDDSRALLETVGDWAIPRILRDQVASAMALSWLDAEPEAARAQFYAAEFIDPAIVAAVRAGRPNWEIRLMLEDSVENAFATDEDREELDEFFGGLY